MAYVDTQAREVALKLGCLGDPALCGAALRWLHDEAGLDATSHLFELSPEHEDETELKFGYVPRLARTDDYRWRVHLHGLEGVTQPASRRAVIERADGLVLFLPTSGDAASALANVPNPLGNPPPTRLWLVPDGAAVVDLAARDPDATVHTYDATTFDGLRAGLDAFVGRIVTSTRIEAPRIEAGTPVGYRRGG